MVLIHKRWPLFILLALAPAIFAYATSSTSGLYTPGPPVVTKVSPYKIRIAINANGNTMSTLYSIQETFTKKYVQRDGSFGNAPTYLRFIDWGQDSGVVVTVKSNTRYRFRTAARLP